MKKTLLVALISLILVGFVSAQYRWEPHWRQNPSYATQTVTVTGSLQLQNGVIAIVNNGKVYYVPSLERLVGFIDDLKEGVQVSVDGYVWSDYDFSYVQPSKLTINGKSYDLQSNAYAMGPHRGYMRQGVRGNGGWCH